MEYTEKSLDTFPTVYEKDYRWWKNSVIPVPLVSRAHINWRGVGRLQATVVVQPCPCPRLLTRHPSPHSQHMQVLLERTVQPRVTRYLKAEFLQETPHQNIVKPSSPVQRQGPWCAYCGQEKEQTLSYSFPGLGLQRYKNIDAYQLTAAQKEEYLTVIKERYSEKELRKDVDVGPPRSVYAVSYCHKCESAEMDQQQNMNKFKR
ncbi:hypothetical protein AAG570_005442 [Ranatra chinensis]|uniref:Uncharacterized protein n=1 Tax=Ranatra chinensis TaxID=642074 RepID=A0ABD0XYG7_9HEMI